MGIVGHGVPADKLQGELGIFMQFPGQPGAPSLAAARRVAPETVGQRVLRRAEERLPTTPGTSPPPGALPADAPAAPGQAATTNAAPTITRGAPSGEPRLPLEMPEPDVGPSHIADFRARYNAQTTHTIAVGRTNVPGLEGVTFEGASPKVWEEANRPPPPPGKYKSPSSLARDRGHAEEGLFNRFDREVKERSLRPSDLEGKLIIHVSNPAGVCTWCRSGLDNPEAPAGIIKQFSMDYPKLVIEFSVATQPGIRTIGPSHFIVGEGK